MFFLIVYLLLPLVILVWHYRTTKFPITMAILLLLLGPLAGTVAMVSIGELTKSNPMPSIIPGAVIFFYFFYGLPIFGLWVTFAGVFGWRIFGRVRLVQEIGAFRRTCLAGGIGTLSGLGFVFVLWSVFSLDPNWPTNNKIMHVVSDPLALISLSAQGMLAGAVCGIIVGQYLDK